MGVYAMAGAKDTSSDSILMYPKNPTRHIRNVALRVRSQCRRKCGTAAALAVEMQSGPQSRPRPRGTFKPSSTRFTPATTFTLAAGRQGDPGKITELVVGDREGIEIDSACINSHTHICFSTSFSSSFDDDEMMMNELHYKVKQTFI